MAGAGVIAGVGQRCLLAKQDEGREDETEKIGFLISHTSIPIRLQHLVF
jgi:hypothetical protein